MMQPETASDRDVTGAVLQSLASGEYWGDHSPTRRAHEGCVITFLDSSGQQFLIARYAWNFKESFLHYLSQLLFERPLPDADLSCWIPVQTIKRFPPMQILLSDRVSAHPTRAAEYLAVVLFPLSLVVFEHGGPNAPSGVTTMKMLETRWQEKLARQKTRESCLGYIASHCVWG
jgi:hypothetical protein